MTEGDGNAGDHPRISRQVKAQASMKTVDHGSGKRKALIAVHHPPRGGKRLLTVVVCLFLVICMVVGQLPDISNFVAEKAL